MYSCFSTLSQIFLKNSFAKVFFFFSRIGHLTFSRNENSFFDRHFETEPFLIVRFADIWLFFVYAHMVQVSYQNSYGKTLKNVWVQVAPPPCAQTEVKSSLGT